MKVLVVDDEPPARDRLRQVIDDIDGYEVVGEAGNGSEALDRAEALTPDIVLLDIRMPGVDGIEAAHHMNRLPRPPAIVFATAYDQYAIDAFEARAVGYVLKPVRRERLELALGQAARLAPATLADIAGDEQLGRRRRHVCARRGDRLKLIPIESVSYFHADRKYVAAHHADGTDLLDDSLKSLEDEFVSDFVRIHRAALVAVAAIASIEKMTDGRSRVVLHDGSQPPPDDLIISRRHVADVRRRLKGD